jgi:hypothetical protein
MKILLTCLLLFGTIGFVVTRGEAAAFPGDEVPASERIATISEGDEVDLDDHLDADGWTVVEFTADW